MQRYNEVCLEYLHSKINFFIEPGISLKSVFDFFSTHFQVKEGSFDQDVIANMMITTDFSELDGIHFENSENVHIRKSASEFFSLPAKRSVIWGAEYITCLKTKTVLKFEAEKNNIQMFIKDANHESMDMLFIELIRDIVLKNEENNGVVVLHASCAFKEGTASVIIGPKGAGKSTTLLELINKFEYQFMSGDKTFIWIEDGILTAAGWPDYPHLGLGTMSKYPAMIHKLNLNEKMKEAESNIWSTEHKLAVDPVYFKEMIPFSEDGLICPIRRFIFPNLHPANECHVMKSETKEEFIEPHIESIFEKDKIWNLFIQPRNQENNNQKQLDFLQEAMKIEAYIIKGSGDIDEHSDIF